MSKTHQGYPLPQIKIKGKGYTQVMKLPKCFLMAIHPCAKFGVPVSKSKDHLAKTQKHGENLILNIEAKGQGQTEVMNVCDTLSYGDILMCQIWYEYVKGLCQKKLWPDHQAVSNTL